MTVEVTQSEREKQDYDAETKGLLAEVQLGLDVKQFLTTDVGRYLLGIAKQEVKDAYAELANADPEDPKLIRKLQNKIKVGNDFQMWLGQAVLAGENAEEQLEQRELGA